MSVSTAQQVALSVPKATGTPGDTLIAWGLAIFLSNLLLDQEAVILRDCGDAFGIEAPVSWAELENAIRTFAKPPARSRLKWLESVQNTSEDKQRKAPLQIDVSFKVDRDKIRDAHRLWRENSRALQRQQGDGEPILTAPADTQLYPFYEVLTNPGAQWTGYNSFVERLYSALTADGVRTLLAQFGMPGGEPSGGSRATRRSARELTFNPPGFLYPGMNKGPTMRVTNDHGTTIGSASSADWALANRGDRTLFENYLAYMGYFQVARIVTTKEQRVVVVPIPDRVEVPYILNHISSVVQRDALSRELEASDLTDYLAAQNALEYGQASLTYLIELQDTARAHQRRHEGLAFRGVHLSIFWRPNGNVYAPRRLTQVALPIWLPALTRHSVDLARETMQRHRARLKSVRGPRRDENKLAPEQRRAIESYLHALNGDLLAWFEAVAAWFPAARAAARRNWNIGVWSTEEVRRIALAMSTKQDQASLAQLLDSPEFKRLASTIRLSTVVPHIAREQRKRNPALEASPWDIRYDLPTRLRQAAERGPKEFLREFYAFIASYNDETARPKTGRGRPLARTDDLVWLSKQMEDPMWSKTLPSALLAFGTSLRGKPANTGESNAGQEPEDDFSDPGPDAADYGEAEE